MQIRDYRDGDFPAIRRLWERSGIYDPERGDDAASIRECNARGGSFLVICKENGTIVGSSWLTHDGRRLFLHHFCIDPICQGQGLGRQLAEASLSYARKIKRPVKLEVRRDNEAARALYEKLGFTTYEDYVPQMNHQP